MADARDYAEHHSYDNDVYDDDLYWINQREADDYRHEHDDVLDEEELGDDPE